MPLKTRHILAADIGGTSSRFGHFSVDGRGSLKLRSLVWLETAAADSFADLLRLLGESAFHFDPRNADMVSIAVAGPITGGIRGNPPNIPWNVDLVHAGRDYGFRRALLINDFEAQAYACLSSAGQSAQIVLPGVPDPRSTIAVIGAGTGMGKAMLVPDGRGGYTAAPSEGAHAAFPFVGEQEFTFQEFLMRRSQLPYATSDHVVSGKGLAVLHEFLSGESLEPPQVAERFSRHPKTIEWFARFYGRACRNFALETLSRGGLYIAGGVAARNPEIVRHDAFKSEFLNAPVMGDVLAELPVYLIADQNSGLWGAAIKAAATLEEGSASGPSSKRPPGRLNHKKKG